MTISASRLALAALLIPCAGCVAEPRVYTQADLQARCIITGGLWHPPVAATASANTLRRA
jgi:hypothetical protein